MLSSSRCACLNFILLALSLVANSPAPLAVLHLGLLVALLLVWKLSPNFPFHQPLNQGESLFFVCPDAMELYSLERLSFLMYRLLRNLSKREGEKRRAATLLFRCGSCLPVCSSRLSLSFPFPCFHSLAVHSSALPNWIALNRTVHSVRRTRTHAQPAVSWALCLFNESPCMYSNARTLRSSPRASAKSSSSNISRHHSIIFHHLVLLRLLCTLFLSFFSLSLQAVSQ